MNVQTKILVACTLLLVATYHHTGLTFPIETHERRKYAYKSQKSYLMEIFNSVLMLMVLSFGK